MSKTEVMLVYDRKDGKPAINPQFFNNNMWMTTKQIADLFETTTQNVDYHRNNIYKDGELAENTTTKDFLGVVNRGFRGQVQDSVQHYSLDMVIAIGYRINSKKATDFRIWATNVLHEYIQKGFALDDERFKQGYPDDKQYFKELRERIKEIRASERMLYQQIKDIYALSADYDNDRQQTMLFFAKVQNKLLFAISGKTGPEIIHSRVDSNKENVGLTSFKNSPDGRVTKQDVEIAKNYLQEPEMKELRYIVNLFLDYAEHKAESEEKIFMREWEILLDDFLAFNRKEILPRAGSISLEKALEKAHNEYFKYRENLKISERKESEIEHKEDIKELEKLLKTVE
ncbi:MAG: virulence RhuM family protein [Alphaproteobacteria bacterium]|nr:virulence RhuM family protein [Alphaproteobacteria bacterium]